jgi:hypothetical protein
LKRPTMVTQQKLLSGEWSPTVDKSHLKENGINKGYRNLIVRQGGNHTFDLMKEKAERGGAQVVELAAWQKIQKEKELFPTKYSMPKTPSLWTRELLPLCLFVDTPMHLLFLGIAKSVFSTISLWSARCGRGPAF